MKSGFLSSVGLHALAIAIAFISFNAVPKPLENQFTEALPITLVPLSDQTSVREGDKTSPLSNKPAPKPTTKPAVKPEATNVGDGEVDIAAPLKPKEKPREVNASQPTAGKPDAKPDSVPPQEKPSETKPAQPQSVESQSKPVEAKPVEPKPVEPKPVEPKPEPVKPEAVKPAQVKPEQAKPEPAKPEQAKPEAVKPEPSKPQSTHAQSVKPAQEIPTQAATQDLLVPKPEEQKPVEPKPAEPKPEAVKPAEPKPAEPKPEAAKPVETKPTEQAAANQQVPPAEPVPQLPTNNAPVPSARPKPEPRVSEQSPTQATKPATPASSSTVGEEVADIINNSPQTAMVDRTRTQGGGAKRSEGEAGYGASKNIGNQENLGQTIGNIIKACMDNAWTLPSGFTNNGAPPMVKATFELSPNGDIIGEPVMTSLSGDPYQARIMETTSLAALKRCSPFKGLPPESYNQWRSIVINLTGQQH